VGGQQTQRGAVLPTWMVAVRDDGSRPQKISAELLEAISNNLIVAYNLELTAPNRSLPISWPKSPGRSSEATLRNGGRARIDRQKEMDTSIASNGRVESFTPQTLQDKKKTARVAGPSLWREAFHHTGDTVDEDGD